METKQGKPKQLSPSILPPKAIKKKKKKSQVLNQKERGIFLKGFASVGMDRADHCVVTALPVAGCSFHMKWVGTGGMTHRDKPELSIPHLPVKKKRREGGETKVLSALCEDTER